MLVMLLLVVEYYFCSISVDSVFNMLEQKSQFLLAKRPSMNRVIKMRNQRGFFARRIEMLFNQKTYECKRYAGCQSQISPIS